MRTLCIGLPLSPRVTVPLKVALAWPNAGKLNSETKAAITTRRKPAVEVLAGKLLIMAFTSPK
jgi:hypothetical protein